MQGQRIIQQYTRRWQLLRWLEGVLYGLGAGCFVGLLSGSVLFGVLSFGIITLVSLVFIKPWKIDFETVTQFIDTQLDTAEYSSSLVLLAPHELSGLAQLQQDKVTAQLNSDLNTITPRTGLKKAAIVSLLLVIFGVLATQLRSFESSPLSPPEQVMTLQSVDSVAPGYVVPVLKDQKVTLNYPEYTRLPARASRNMNVKVVEGSRLSWSLDFEGTIPSAVWEGLGEVRDMRISHNAIAQGDQSSATITVRPLSSGYYNFRFTDSLGSNYASEIYAIEVTPDAPPELKVKELAQFTSFDYDDAKEIQFTAQITDDYGIAGAEIIATVTKGSGESVKFREERLSFDQSIKEGSKALQLSKTIDLDALKMEVGDELYFYVMARDQKTPRPNITRSETFFAVIKDTVSDGFVVEGTMGADLMPDYFRSQRQLIIDTEKLIKERPELTEKEFKSRSNELGFDQKSLRLKYGKFMGDEADSGIAVQPDINIDDFDEDDPTAGFRHDHDTENEHNLVAEEDHDHEDTHDHIDEGEESKEESFLEDYLHNHDDPEESTLFTASLRGKLKQAMAEMWDAELYLRLATPEESLPYQYKALKLIQEIKNSARIYVHRIGFDPPPIKEDKRLSGDLDEIETTNKQDDLAKEDAYKVMRQSVRIIEDRIALKEVLTNEDKEAFAKAGQELATIAINEPAKHLVTLQRLKWLTEDKVQPVDIWRKVQKGLSNALPTTTEKSPERSEYKGTLEDLFIQELKTRD